MGNTANNNERFDSIGEIHDNFPVDGSKKTTSTSKKMSNIFKKGKNDSNPKRKKILKGNATSFHDTVESKGSSDSNQDVRDTRADLDDEFYTPRDKMSLSIDSYEQKNRNKSSTKTIHDRANRVQKRGSEEIIAVGTRSTSSKQSPFKQLKGMIS